MDCGVLLHQYKQLHLYIVPYGPFIFMSFMPSTGIHNKRSCECCTLHTLRMNQVLQWPRRCHLALTLFEMVTGEVRALAASTGDHC